MNSAIHRFNDWNNIRASSSSSVQQTRSHTAGRAARKKKPSLTVFVFSLPSCILLEKWRVKWGCKFTFKYHTLEQKKKSINTSNWFKSLPLNRSRRCRPTYQHAVSKLGKGVRVLTFSRFSISYALREREMFELNIVLHHQQVYCNKLCKSQDLSKCGEFINTWNLDGIWS